MSLFARLLDDAAIFPPGDLPLDRAVPEHLTHRRAEYGALVGPFVVGAGGLHELGPVVAPLPPGSLAVAVTTPVSALAGALAAADTLAAVRVVAVEVTLTDGMSPDEAIALVGQGSEWRVFVELPRDERREPLLAALARAGLAAKLRTGGLSADAFPREEELASTVVATVRAGVPFKATAGLHHAIRNTDPGTGFEQHGFLNLLIATAAARGGAGTGDVARLLAERDPEQVVAGVREVDGSVREWFRSFGTCSIAEPVAELEALGLLPKVPA